MGGSSIAISAAVDNAIDDGREVDVKDTLEMSRATPLTETPENFEKKHSNHAEQTPATPRPIQQPNTSDIDKIWSALKDECSITSISKMKGKDISHLWESNQPAMRKFRESTEYIPQPIDSREQKEVENTYPLKCNTQGKSEEQNVQVTRFVCGADSDDDSDGEMMPPRLKVLKHQRLAGLIQSGDKMERAKALSDLKHEIHSLHHELQEDIVPPLSNPPPYNIQSITLTHKQYNATVSDLAKGNHVEGWDQWERTLVPITKQFPRHESQDRKLERKVDKDRSNARQKLQIILDSLGTSLFKRIGDSSEQCRSSAIESLQLLCLSGLDFGKHIAYIMPAILSRYPETQYDGEMKIFVHDTEKHDFYKRGGAIRRQDQKNILERDGGKLFNATEPSEELRLGLCGLLECLLRSCVHLNVVSLLDAYFSDMILAIQSHLRDPFPKLNIAAAKLLVQVLRFPAWEIGAKFYATAVARASLPQLRHKSSHVRVACIALLEASISVPDREKIKGAGSEAIGDVVGFREDNVLPIAAFYKSDCGITVNVLAELVIDKNANVRFRCCKMLSFLICCLPDRYDFQQRLLPYLLSFYNDEHQHIRLQAMKAVKNCGQQYEAEHPDEIIERRQYGVDGDCRCNHSGTLPQPFEQRPRIGARLFVRGNTKRFFKALVSELRNWMPRTRHQSAQLLQTLVIYCEEHLTMDFHNTLPGIVKALQSCLVCNDVEANSLKYTLECLLTTMGRYVDPATFVKLLLPRIIGDISSTTSFSEGGVHSEASCVANALALRCLMKGSSPHRVLSHFFLILPALSSPAVLGQFAEGKKRLECLKTLLTLFELVKGMSLHGAQTAHFEETGRICDATAIIQSLKDVVANLPGGDEDAVRLGTLLHQAIPPEFNEQVPPHN